jgi:hypothetical protein
VGDKLTSAQANAIDISTTHALDKTSAGDAIAGIVTCTAAGPGRVIPTYLAGVDADHTYALSAGISFLDASAGLTADRSYTLSTTGAVAGDCVFVRGNATYNVSVLVGGTTLLVVGANTFAHSPWGEFFYNGSTWKLKRGAHSESKSKRMAFRPESWTDTPTTTGSVPPATLKYITNTDVSFSSDAVILKTVNTGTSASYAYHQPIPIEMLDNGMVLSSVVVRLVGAAAHGGLPQQMPAVAVVLVSSDSTLTYMKSTSNGWAIDGSANTGAYQASHNITFTPDQFNTIDHATYSYSLYLLGEGGANALINPNVYSVIFNMTYP